MLHTHEVSSSNLLGPTSTARRIPRRAAFVSQSICKESQRFIPLLQQPFDQILMKWLHNLLKGASLTTALFIFQACYGVPDAWTDEYVGDSTPMSFALVSNETGNPIEGIQITGSTSKGGREWLLGTTGPEGKCRVDLPYIENVPGPFLRFEDPNGHYAAKDTSFMDLRDREILIGLDNNQ